MNNGTLLFVAKKQFKEGEDELRNKKYGKQLLSILLAGMLSLNVPVIALAESEEFLAAEEQVQEAADFTDPEANEAVGDGEFSDFIAGDEAA